MGGFLFGNLRIVISIYTNLQFNTIRETIQNYGDQLVTKLQITDLQTTR